MCCLTCILASRCRHPLSYQYDYCNLAPYPHRCPIEANCVDAYLVDNSEPHCEQCKKEIVQQTYAEFYEQRREVMKQARTEDLGNVEISMMRKVLRDQFYEKLKYTCKPLPALPKGADPSSSASVKKLEKELNAKGFYLLGMNAPIEVEKERRLIKARQEVLRGQI